MAFVLTSIGIASLLVSLAALAFGLFMAADPKNREQGRLFAIWWVPGVAAASGILMRDVVTLTVGLLCFLVAGAAFVFANPRSGKPVPKRHGGTSANLSASERTTKENEADPGYNEAAS